MSDLKDSGTSEGEHSNSDDSSLDDSDPEMEEEDEQEEEESVVEWESDSDSSLSDSSYFPGSTDDEEPAGLGQRALKLWRECDAGTESEDSSQPLKLKDLCVKVLVSRMKRDFLFSRPLPWPIKDIWTAAEILNVDSMKRELFDYLLVRFETDEVRNLVLDTTKTSPQFMRNLLAYVKKHGKFDNEQIEEPHPMEVEHERSCRVLPLADQCVRKLVSAAGCKDSSFAININKVFCKGEMDAPSKNSYFKKIMGNWNSDPAMVAVEIFIKVYSDCLMDLWTFAMSQLVENRYLYTIPEIDEEDEKRCCYCRSCREMRKDDRADRRRAWFDGEPYPYQRREEEEEEDEDISDEEEGMDFW